MDGSALHEFRRDQAVEQAQLSLLGNATCLWLTKSTRPVLSKVILQPVSAVEVKGMIKAMLTIPVDAAD